MKHGTLLVVDDNRNILTTVKMVTEQTFERIICLASPSSLLTRLREDQPDVVLLDMNFHSGINNGNEGLYWLREIKKARPQTAVVLFTAYADIELAVTGLKDGAADFIVKPFDNHQLIEKLTDAYQKTRKKKPTITAVSEMIWGTSPAMRHLRDMVEKVAGTDANILITGENGTGKEVLAKEIHRLSKRAGKALMPIDLGAVTETLFESELFGYVKGAFTDAKTDKPGKFELAEGGTLFLDEIGEMPLFAQPKLLRILQEYELERIGSSKKIHLDIRIIAATNRDLAEMVDEGRFRSDLYYRINVINLELPPLRARRDDIIPLAENYLKKLKMKMNTPLTSISPEACEELLDYDWPGNIRQLQNVVEYAANLCESDTLMPSDLPETVRERERAQTRPSAYSAPGGSRDEDVLSLLEKYGYTLEGKRKIAEELGISLRTLYRRISHLQDAGERR